jgi:DNA replication and repair protein RecF
MRIDWVALTGFRSYQSLEWSPDPGVNLLIGPNGAGKTNALEAIGYLATLRSFRGVTDAELVHDEAESAVVRSGVASDDRERLVEIQINRKGPRVAQVDKNRLRRASEMLGVFRVVTFLPDDLDLVKRGPAHRRDFLDEVAVQLWPGAYVDQSEFDRALRQRNAFLKSGDRDESTLGVWDSRLAQSGGRVLARRARVVEALASRLSDAYREISSSDLGLAIGYAGTWSGAGTDLLPPKSAAEYATLIATGLETARRVDFDRRLTTVGPHRDEPSFELAGHDARTHGSQGEQRSTALSAKLAAHRAIAQSTGETPALLLDDVFSELDPERSAALASALPDDAQTLITSARPEDIPLEGSLWKVDDGIVR